MSHIHTLATAIILVAATAGHALGEPPEDTADHESVIGLLGVRLGGAAVSLDANGGFAASIHLQPLISLDSPVRNIVFGLRAVIGTEPAEHDEEARGGYQRASAEAGYAFMRPVDKGRFVLGAVLTASYGRASADELFLHPRRNDKSVGVGLRPLVRAGRLEASISLDAIRTRDFAFVEWGLSLGAFL